MSIHEITTVALSSATILAFPVATAAKTKRARRAGHRSEACAAIVSFPAAVVAAKAERARRVQRTRKFLQAGNPPEIVALIDSMPEWMLYETSELFACTRGEHNAA